MFTNIVPLNRGVLICTFTIRYDTIEEFNVDSKVEYSAHVARNKNKQSKCPFNSVQVKSSRRNTMN